MRILIISQFFAPEPSLRPLALTRKLKALGHEVQVLTGFPNYPLDKLYQGYRTRLVQREVVEGISVLRVPVYPSHANSAFRRILNSVSLAISASLWGVWLVKPCDVVFVYGHPSMCLPAMLLHFFRRRPWVYDLADLWPDTVLASGMCPPRPVLGLIRGWCNLAYRRATRLTVVSPGFVKPLIERGVPAEKIDVIYHWCDEEQIQTGPADEALARKLGLSGRFNFVYAGNIGAPQALGAVIEAAALLADRLPEVQFVFVGDGVELDRLNACVAERGLRNVRFLPRQPMSEIGAILSLADVLLIHLDANPLWTITIPSKTQSSLAAGKPILMAVEGEAAALVQRAGAGIICKPGDPESIARAAEELCRLSADERRAMGTRGRQFYEAELSMDVGVPRLIRVLEAAMAEQGQLGQHRKTENTKGAP